MRAPRPPTHIAPCTIPTSFERASATGHCGGLCLFRSRILDAMSRALPSGGKGALLLTMALCAVGACNVLTGADDLEVDGIQADTGSGTGATGASGNPQGSTGNSMTGGQGAGGSSTGATGGV